MDNKLQHYLNNKNFRRRRKKKSENNSGEEKITTQKTIRTTKNVHWNELDTEHFYTCLKICSVDFSLISTLFKNKTRKQIKKKFQKEMKINKNKIEFLLKNAKFCNKEYEKLKTRIEDVSDEKENIENQELR